MAFENPDGSPITFDKDYYGVVSECRLPGAFADIGGFDKEL
jgi:hypothetical protein